MTPARINRREFLGLASAALPAWAFGPRHIERWLPRLTFFAPPGIGPRGDVLVVLFQRGGMDGLNAVIPHGEPEYYRRRPNLAIPEPRPGDDSSGIDLDGFFGLHPALRALKDVWDDGALAIIHACGSPDPTHSHFDAMDFMERGTPGEKQIPTGWLARHLETVAWENDSPFRAVGFGDMLQSSLRGPVPATALQSIAEFHLGGRVQADAIARFQETVAELYQQKPSAGAGERWSELNEAAALTLSVSEQLGTLVGEGYTPAAGAQYPESHFGQTLRQVAQLIKAEVGLEVAAVDIGGWDTHVNQGGLEGPMPGLLADLGNGLAAFYHDLAERTKDVTVVTMSEFGRRVAENGGRGTDHGHGNVMFVMGGGVQGGRVYGEWPGLEPTALYGPGDLPITTDFRDVLGEIVQKRLANDRLESVFPSYSSWQFRGIVTERS